MRAKGQLLISTLLLFLFHVAAQDGDAHATGGAESAEDGTVRIPSSDVQTPPAVGTSSSSSSSSSSGSTSGGGGSSAFTVPAAAAINQVLDAMHATTKLTPELAHSSQLFTQHAHKLPLPASPPTGPDRAPSDDDDSHQQKGEGEVKGSEHYHRHYRRVRRGGYNIPYFVGKRALEQEDGNAKLQELEFQKRDATAMMEEEEEDVPEQQRDIEHLDRVDLSMLLSSDTMPKLAFVDRGGELDALSDQGQSSESKRQAAPYFVGKRTLEENESLEQEELQKRDSLAEDAALTHLPDDIEAATGHDDVAIAADPDKKRRAPYFVGKRRAPYFLGKRGAPYFIGKRGAPYFIGKRGAPYFIGKRGAPYFIGKRGAPYFIGKRGAPYFIGKRGAPYFIGKRGAPYFIGKRGAPYFVGKRGAPYFIGKRGAPYFIGKRGAPYFIGKRGAPYFIGKRGAPYFIGKRGAPYFIGKRGAPYFIGKRNKRSVPDVPEKRPAPYFVGRRTSPASPFFVGRRRFYSPLFIGKKRDAPVWEGKRANGNSPSAADKGQSPTWTELLSALRRLQAARHYRRLIQTDKRHNSPFFIGRRSSE